MESGSCESVVAEGSGVNRGASDIETRERATLLVTHSVNGPIATTNNHLRIFFGEDHDSQGIQASLIVLILLSNKRMLDNRNYYRNLVPIGLARTVIP